MKRIPKLALFVAAGALAAAALTGCSAESRKQVVDGYTSFQDGVVSSWNNMVDEFKQDASYYGITPDSEQN